ncbi:MAG: RidA family protein [Flavobacteriales bacterium]|jgi:enamine deaminase RidA (YjgF/YER057c/UK114 family)|nr:RidA family protein [Flavobacteriales bacterium]MCB0758288.1 RidA family protein [Flavobacteriales bacterium]
MKYAFTDLRKNLLLLAVAALPVLLASAVGSGSTEEPRTTPTDDEKPEWFSLRPDVEKAYGYTHAVRIGDAITISGAVSMDNEGNATAVGDLGQQMKNCYSDLDKILKHYGCTFDDVVAEHIFTTDMAGFLKHAEYRGAIYTKQFPAGSWLEVKGLALPEFMIEIELEVHKPQH